MKFEFEIIKTLKTVNSKEETCILSEGDKVWLKLDFARMNLYDPKSYMRRYPDGWVRGVIHSISDSGKRLYFSRSDEVSNLLVLNPPDILDISDKVPAGHEGK